MKPLLKKTPRWILPLVVLLVLLVLLMPRTAKFNYDYKKGSPWPYETLISQFDFPILKTQEQILEEREQSGSSVIPYYRYSDEVVNNSIKAVEGLDLGKYNSLKPVILGRITDIYSKGVIPDGRVKLDRGSATVSSEIIYIQKNKRAQKYPVSEVFKVSDARNKLLADLSGKASGVNLDSLLSRSGVYDIIVPNLVFDKAATDLVHSESPDFISPTQGYISADQKIVSNGEIVTAEIAQVLDSYKDEYNKVFGYDGPRILLWLGNIILALALVVILALSIYYTNPLIFNEWNRYVYLLLVFFMTAAAAFIIERTNPQSIFLIPFSVSALYLVAFFSKRVTVTVYTVSLMPLLIFSGNGMELFVMYLTAGVVAVYVFQYFHRGWLQFITAIIVFLTLVLVYCGFRLIDAGSSHVLHNIWYLFLGSLLSVALYPMTYLFEKIFNLVSVNRLLELADTNNKLLRELSVKAPGTFQHSLQVMAMADEAARSIGADVPLVRAGALYHDIGKMANPLCFIENETPGSLQQRYHDALSPEESARDIIRHVPDGLSIADRNSLPDVIKDFILTHHGTSCTAYFYNKYLNSGGDPSGKDAFCYPGMKPHSREQVLVMLCDSIEAASRTLKENTPEAYSDFVENIVAGKMKAGQLDESDISVRDLETVKAVLKSYLARIYHERVEYPKN